MCSVLLLRAWGAQDLGVPWHGADRPQRGGLTGEVLTPGPQSRPHEDVETWGGRGTGAGDSGLR